MTIKQKQCLLYFLGYYDGEIDGIWGEKSRAAEERFRQSHGVLGEAIREAILEALPTESADWWEEIEYFAPEEFACKCGGLCGGYPAQMAQTLVCVADRVRKALGTACIVSSGLRCRQHNANVGGVSNSRHLSGKAMDFRAVGKTAAQVLAVVRAQPEIRYAYAIDNQFVHMDVE